MDPNDVYTYLKLIDVFVGFSGWSRAIKFAQNTTDKPFIETV